MPTKKAKKGFQYIGPNLSSLAMLNEEVGLWESWSSLLGMPLAEATNKGLSKPSTPMVVYCVVSK